VGTISLAAILALAAGFAHAEDLEWETNQDNTASLDKGSKAPPLNLNGCWGGSEKDSGGNGNLFINFAQKGKKITKSSNAQITYSTGSGCHGPVSGSVNSQMFAIGFHHGSKCNLSIKGTLPNGGPNLQGNFNLNCPAVCGPQQNVPFTLTRNGPGC
jgi:hypothetical protein